MAKRKSGALKTAKFPPPSPFRKNENIDKANVAFGDLEFEAELQEYVKDSPMALLALQDINKRGGISKFIKALQKGDEDYRTTVRGSFNPRKEQIEYNATDVLDMVREFQNKRQPHPLYGKYYPTKAANLVQGSMPSIAHELFHYGMNLLRKQGYDVTKDVHGTEEDAVDFLEKYQARRMGIKEEDFDKAARDTEINLKTIDPQDFLTSVKANKNLDQFESMALSELEKRNYARTKKPLKDTREKSFLEKLAVLNPFREKPRPMYREGGVVNMLKKMK